MSTRKRDGKPPGKTGKPKNRSSDSPPTVAPVASLTPGMQQIQTFMQGMDLSAQTSTRNAFLYITQSLVGKTVQVRLKDGFLFDAVFSALAPRDDGKSHFVFKGVRPKAGASHSPAIETGSVLVVESDKVAQVSASSVNLQLNHRPEGLSTDSEIKKKDLAHLMNRDLKAADNSWFASDPATSTDLEDSKGPKGKAWDQFQANEQMFAVKTSFDENLYTTRLDKSKFTAAQEQEAARLARAIESQRSQNIHVAEERNQATEHELDEEDLYSGVVRTGNGSSNADDSTKYRPPSQRRNPGQRLQKKGSEQDDSPRIAENAPASPAPITQAEPAVTSPPPGLSDEAEDVEEVSHEVEAPEEQAKEPAAQELQPEEPSIQPAPTEKKKFTFNPDAKEFSFNPQAKEFVPPPVPMEPMYPVPGIPAHMVPGYPVPMGMEQGGYSYEVYDPSMGMPMGMGMGMGMSMEEQYAMAPPMTYAYGYNPVQMDPHLMQMQGMYMNSAPPVPGYPMPMNPGVSPGRGGNMRRPPGSPYGSGGNPGRGQGGRGRPRNGSLGEQSDTRR